MALTVAFQHFGISRRRVRGVVPQRISTASRAPMPRRVPLPSLRVATHKTPEYRAKQAENMKRIWAKRKAQQMAATVAIIKGSAQERDVRRLKDIGLGEDLINSGLQYAAASGEFTQLAGISLGIDSEQWAALCEYVIANGDALQNKYGKRFKVVRDGGEKRIVVAS